MARYDIGRHAKTTAVKRSLARRERDVEVSEAFLLKIERGVLRRAKRTDALFKRAGMEEYHVPPRRRGQRPTALGRDSPATTVGAPADAIETGRGRDGARAHTKAGKAPGMRATWTS